MQESLGGLLGPQEEPPEFYTDAVKISFNLYGVILEFASQRIPDTPGSETPQLKRLAWVRMSPQHALVFSKMLQKHLEIYQQKVGPIAIPAEIYRDLGLGEEG